jgi:hypothetical protein
MKLAIGEGLRLPLDWMTMATVVYGARGSGKTTFGSVVAEEVAKHAQRFCAIDLKGDWYGLKSTANGKGAGLPVVIFGGDHADLPLEETAGAFIGETIATLEQPAIVDLEQFSKGKQVRFLAAFFERLYDANRTPLLLLMDEAQRYAPQRPIDPDAAKCLGAVEDLVKLGRKHGIGPILLTQRGSGLNKEVSELCDMLVAFRTPGPLDQDRIKDWLDANATKEQRDQVLGSLAGLSTGTAIIASGHPDLKVFGTFTIRRRETFDSSATPTIGHRRAEPKRLARPDLEALQIRMAAAIERQKAEDPRELRRQIAELKAQLATKPPAPAQEQPAKTIEKCVLKDGQLARAERLVAALDKTLDRIGDVDEDLSTVAKEIRDAIAKTRQAPPVHQPAGRREEPTLRAPGPAPAHPRGTASRGRPSRRAPLTTAAADGTLSTMHRRMLTALAQHPDGLTKKQVLVHTGYASSGPVSSAFADLAREGWATANGHRLHITDAGRQVLGPVDPLPLGDALREWLLTGDKLSTMERALLTAICAAYPDPIRKGDVLEQTGYASSGPVSSAFAKLVAYHYAVPQGVSMLRAADELFS